jgi:uncharacterized protein YggE
MTTLLVAALVLALAGCTQPALAGSRSSQAALLAAQSWSEPAVHSLSVNGVGTTSAPPYVADIQLGVDVSHTDPELAVSDSTERMRAVMDTLAKMGVAEKDIQTVNYSLWPEAQHDEKGTPTGESLFRVVHQIRVRLYDLSKVGELLHKALQAGANTVGGVSFSVADPVALRLEARDRAIANARAKAEQLAEGLDVQLGPARQITEFGDWSVPVEAAEGRAWGGGVIPMPSGSFSVRVEIQVTFELVQQPD